ncbi:hypothetical protein SDC9_212851 [bioreactor metagenome]|uniref:Uncharacterized protein n=1 Tax=bioreactor metagenome TaxID=1076179 RepID=A0A645JP47_9ZZZZ
MTRFAFAQYFFGIFALSNIFEDNCNATMRLVFDPEGKKFQNVPLNDEVALESYWLTCPENSIISLKPFFRFFRKCLPQSFSCYISHT